MASLIRSFFSFQMLKTQTIGEWPLLFVHDGLFELLVT